VHEVSWAAADAEVVSEHQHAAKDQLSSGSTSFAGSG
jgi:hypothetical protein